MRSKQRQVSKSQGPSARESLLDAAQAIIKSDGFAGISTRKVAARAGVPLSQIHYHFGSKEGLLLGLLDHLDAQALRRQSGMYARDLPLSRRWRQACDFLEEDLASGYVRLLHECTALGWANEAAAQKMCQLMYRWRALLTEVAEEAKERFGGFGPFGADEVAELVGLAFMGAESLLLLGIDENRAPIRSALRKVGRLIENLEKDEGGRKP